MDFTILIGSEIKKIEHLYNRLTRPSAQMLLTNVIDDPEMWEWMEKEIGKAIVTYIKEHYYGYNQ